MLALTRKKGETIIIHENIEVTVLDIQGDKVKLGINAPKEIDVLRKEIYEQIKMTNQESTIIEVDAISKLSNILK